MQIDWTTLVLEIINFLVLVWILKRFLYRPVMEAIAARQQRVEGKLAEARAIEDGARELQQQYQRRLADWDMEKAKALAGVGATRQCANACRPGIAAVASKQSDGLWWERPSHAPHCFEKSQAGQWLPGLLVYPAATPLMLV